MGWPPQWLRDPKTGTRASSRYGLSIPVTDRRAVGDIKYLWEPSRHHDLVVVAQAWAATRDVRYLEALVTLLDSWIEQNPHPLGPHWSSSLEAAIRLINWSLAWHLAGGADAASEFNARYPELARRWRDAVYWHVRFVRDNLSAHSSANNHLIGELAGLVVGLCTWPSWRSMRGWAAEALERLRQQAGEQITEDGVHREQAVAYQVFVWEFLHAAGRCAQANGHEPGPAYWRRLEAMADFVAALTDAGGHLPCIGDADDGAACGVFVGAVPAWMSLLATAALAFERGDLARAAAGADARTVFWHGADSGDRLGALRRRGTVPPLPRAFPSGGYVVFGDRAHQPDEVRAVFDIGALGYLSIAAHGHADALSLHLSVGGRPVLVDPGTYCYHGPIEWREHFRSTAAHNTVEVDGLSSSRSGGRFMWVRHARVRDAHVALEGPLQKAGAAHDGYAALARGSVIHRREVCFDGAANVLEVVDTLTGRGRHDLALRWQLAPSVAARFSGSTCELALDDDVRLRLVLPAELAWTLRNAVEASAQAWVSPGYEQRTGAIQLVGLAQDCPLPSRLVTRMEIARRSDHAPDAGTWECAMAQESQ
ncbi:MAG: alginate lyase family protein [Burkholderiales bacterium]